MHLTTVLSKWRYEYLVYKQTQLAIARLAISEKADSTVSSDCDFRVLVGPRYLSLK